MTNSGYSISLDSIIEEFHLETCYRAKKAEQVAIVNNEVNRPGMQIVGFYDYFEPSRIQILGKVEMSYLQEFATQARRESFDKLLATGIPMVVVTRGMEVFPELLEAAEAHDVTICRTGMSTSGFTAAVISYLNLNLAPRITRHGVLVEVHGEGVLILGESGVGKSECAVELVKRGHRFVADDAVEIKRVSDKTLVGSAPDIIRYFIELRGIGIVDIRRLYGMGAVKVSEKIDLVIHLEPWEDAKQYDRLGLVDEYTNILGINVPSLTIPVRPGRNLAVIVEVAAMNNRSKKYGFNAAQQLADELERRVQGG